MLIDKIESHEPKSVDDCLTPEQALTLASPSILRTLLEDMPDEHASNKTYRNADGTVLLWIRRVITREGPSHAIFAVDTKVPDLSDEGLDCLIEDLGNDSNSVQFKSGWARLALRDILILTPDQLEQHEVPRDTYNAEEYRVQGCIAAI